MIQHGVYLTWQNVNANIKGKQILNDITGHCVPGSSLAIMGPSGAGKTTLLSILASKIDSSMNIEGQVLANGMKYTQNDFYNFASYVYQNDILCEALTVKETLSFTAKLKIKNQQNALQRVQELISDFNLKKCQDTFVGGKFIKGISGGQKKRVCIAVQLVTKPDLLILDEPTSGLDSYMANNMISLFEKLAKKQGKTIIFTIHQPSYKMFSKLDRLLLLHKGQCLYQGEASGIFNYIQSLKITIPSNTTICDFFMFEISEYKARANNYQTKLTNQSYEKNLKDNVLKEIETFKEETPDGYKKTTNENTFFRQLTILLQRQLKIFKRNPMKFGRSLGNTILTIVLLGVIFFHTILDQRPSTQIVYHSKMFLIVYFIQAQSSIFVCLTSTVMSGIFSVVLLFPVEREIFTKQIASKTYNALPYFISKILTQVIILVISIIIFASGVYWLIGFSTDFGLFCKFILLLCSIALVGNSIGIWTGSLFKNAQRSAAMAPMLIMPLMMFAGLYNKLDSIPAWISWFQYLSPFRYGLHALLQNEFGSSIYKYWQGGVQKEFSYQQNLSINLSYFENVFILLGLSVLFYFMAFCFLKKLTSRLAA